jgi:hypothetical protein
MKRNQCEVRPMITSLFVSPGPFIQQRTMERRRSQMRLSLIAALVADEVDSHGR